MVKLYIIISGDYLSVAREFEDMKTMELYREGFSNGASEFAGHDLQYFIRKDGVIENLDYIQDVPEELLKLMRDN